MPQFKKIGYAAWSAASNTTLTSVITLDTGYSEYAVEIPAAMYAAAQSSVIVALSCDTVDGTFRPIYWSNTGAGYGTITCAIANNKVQTLATIAVSGGFQELNGLKYCAGYLKFQADTLTTKNTGIGVYAKVGF